MSTVWWTCDHEYLRECRDALSELKYNVTLGKRYVTRSVLAVADSYTALDRSEEIVPRLRWLIEARLARPPWCPACHRPMRLESAGVDREDPKLRHVIFVCDCGRISDQLVAV